MIFLLSSVFMAISSLHAASPLEMHCQMVFAKSGPDSFKVVPGLLVTHHFKHQKFKIQDIKNNFYFIATLINRKLAMNVFLSDFERQIRSGLQGSRLYKEMLDYIGLENIDVIVGKWYEGTNYDAYFSLRAKGYSPQESAFGTWSGQQATEYGFNKIKSIKEVTNRNGTFAYVYVEFVR